MDDRKLDVIIEAFRVGSFSKAANTLNCTQSAVTQTVNAVEKELGIRLFSRTHSGICLTEEGEKIMPLILDVDVAMKKLFEESSRITGNKKTVIKIGTFSSISNTWLPSMIKKFKKKHSDINFDILIGTNDVGLWMKEGEIDIGLGDVERLGEYNFTPLMKDPFLAVVPEDFNLREEGIIYQDELENTQFIMPTTNAMEKHLQVLPKNQIKVKCDDDFSLLALVEQGLGVTVLPSLGLSYMNHNAVELPISPPCFRTLGVGLTKGANKASKAFAKFLVEEFKENKNPYDGNIKKDFKR